jgi:GNAT superfamily N-acetyltransferase
VAEHRFAGSWSEEASLADGTRVVLRLLRPEDAPILARGFERLSPTSRYKRFLSARTGLTKQDLDYLTNVDGHHHVAIGALDQHGEGLGVARFVRLAEDEHKAEAAVTVIDDMQGKGLGGLLLNRLAGAAVERGVDHFRCSVLANNEPMRLLIEKLAPEGREVRHGEVVEVDIALPPLEAQQPEVAEDHPLYRILIGAAAGVLVVAHTTAGLRDWLLPTKKQT